MLNAHLCTLLHIFWWTGPYCKHNKFYINYNTHTHSYFDFFEEAFNYIAYKGYIRMTGEDEKEWIDTMNNVHSSVKGGMKYNTGKLLMVLYKPISLEEGDYA